MLKGVMWLLLHVWNMSNDIKLLSISGSASIWLPEDFSVLYNLYHVVQPLADVSDTLRHLK